MENDEPSSTLFKYVFILRDLISECKFDILIKYGIYLNSRMKKNVLEPFNESQIIAS
jgi:hypothetical protein